MRAFFWRQAGWAGACAIALSGCANLPALPGGASATPAPAPQAAPVLTSGSGPVTSPVDTNNVDTEVDSAAGSVFDNLDVVDPSLKGKLAILRVGSEPSANDLLSVFAGLKNRTGRRLNLEVETVYKDKSGGPLNSGSWISVTLRPHGETEYRSTSISDQATDFLIRVRRAAPGT
jgi:hypothetical protein